MHRVMMFLQKAKELGLGNFNPSDIEIDGTMQVLDNFKLPPLGGEAIADNQAIQQLMHTKINIRPAADPEVCTACGACIDHCPVSALTMEKTTPVVDPEICITCFCCQEMCPEKAITLS